MTLVKRIIGMALRKAINFKGPWVTQDYLLQGTRRFGELGGKQWKANPTRGSIYPILFSTYVHFRSFNISHIQSLEEEAPACTISLSWHVNFQSKINNINWKLHDCKALSIRTT